MAHLRFYEKVNPSIIINMNPNAVKYIPLNNYDNDIENRKNMEDIYIDTINSSAIVYSLYSKRYLCCTWHIMYQQK